ncbi:MAG: insulinase family protein [Clostridia bacterium]|nr:insulinase family protein [Clostridia bacterium]
MNIKTSRLCDGVYLAACKTEKFKSAVMTVSFAVPLDVETASGYSLLTNLLSLSTGSYNTMQSFSVIKDELYALGLDAFVQRRGEILLVRLEINTIADSFAFDGERVLYRATQLLGDAIFNPHLENGVFPTRNVETEKDCLIEEIESLIENKPSYAMFRARQIMCKGEPFAVDAGGETERVLALDGEQLIGFHRHIIENAPIFITYAGEADFEYVEECVKAHLNFTPRENKLPDSVVHTHCGEILRVREEMEMEQTVLILGFTTEMPDTPKKRAILTVYDEIFGGSPASKLFMNVREKEGLCYYCSSYPAARKNILFVSCGLEDGFEDKAIDAINNEVDEMKLGNFTDSDLQNAKNSIIRALKSFETDLNSINGYLLGQIINEVSSTVEENIELVLSVTRDEVIEFAKCVTPELIYILGGANE